jgi:hypothetical protein
MPSAIESMHGRSMLKAVSFRCARAAQANSAGGIDHDGPGVADGRAARFPSRGILAALGALTILFAVDGLNSFLYLLSQTPGRASVLPNLYQPNNVLRLITGSGMGITLGGLLLPALNLTIWREPADRSALEPRAFLTLLACVGAMDALVLTEAPAILYAAGALSALGVLALLSAVLQFYGSQSRAEELPCTCASYGSRHVRVLRWVWYLIGIDLLR